MIVVSVHVIHTMILYTGKMIQLHSRPLPSGTVNEQSVAKPNWLSLSFSMREECTVGSATRALI